MKRFVALLVLSVIVAAPCVSHSAGWTFGAYLDVGYLKSDNEPDNRTWRSKSTSSSLDGIEANMVTAYMRKTATPASRWGVEVGFQTGVDVDGLVTSAPPPANTPLNNANSLSYLSTTTVSYLFSAGRGLLVTGGLMSSWIAWESYYAKNNPNYPRGYLTDGVPYFVWGVKAYYPFNDELAAEFWVVTGYNYLTNPNDVPSYGAQLSWSPASPLTVKQNFYYGPDQADTAIEYWRFLSDTIVEWKSGRFVLAASCDFGTERQSWLPDTPRNEWMAGALWGQVDVTESWRFGARPEFYWDPDGLMLGAPQTIWSVAATVEYHANVLKYNALSARLEYRYDRSTGSGGGFYKGADNHRVPEQNLIILALMWSFDWQE